MAAYVKHAHYLTPTQQEWLYEQAHMHHTSQSAIVRVALERLIRDETVDLATLLRQEREQP